jgi:peptide/nickel transport system permease protein
MRTSLLVAAIVVAASAIIGGAIGLISGYVGGWVDTAIMRIGDVIVTLPSLLIALAVLFVLSPSMLNLIIVLTITRIPVYMRTARAQTLAVREQVFVEASRALGARSGRIVFHDVQPLIVPTILTLAMLELAGVMLSAAGLSFLGVGLQRPSVDLGTMVSDGRSYLAVAWWATVFPGIAIAIAALAANIVSNWLRAVSNPMTSGALAASTTRNPEA